MRSCIYCGRELEKGESCMCAGAVKARREKQEQHTEEKQKDTKGSYSGWQENVYQTGYTKKEKKRFRDRFKRAHKFKKSSFNSSDFKNAAGDVSGFAKRFMREPVSAVSNPGIMNMWQIIVIIVLTSVFLSLCGYFAYARIIRTFLSGIASVTANLALPGYSIGVMLKTTLYSSLSLIFVCFVYLGVLYLVNRFIMKASSSFKTFITRPVAAMTPLLVLSALGAVISFFTVYATVMLVLTGVIMWLVLTYEALRTEWSFAPAAKTMYAMALAFFVFFVVMFNVLRII